MSRIAYLAAFLIVSGVVIAQDDNKDGVNAINTGPLIPVAEFSSSSMSDGGGFAGNGWNGKLDYFSYFREHPGINFNLQ